MQMSSTGLSPASSIILGCCVAVVSSAIQSLGITLQRKSHLISPYSTLSSSGEPHTPTRTYHDHAEDDTTEENGNITLQNNPTTAMTPHHLHSYKRNMWLCGFFLFIIANVLGSLIQITTLPLIILSPLQSIGLIFNSILSCILLPGETFTHKLAIGTAIIAIGAFIIAYNGNLPPFEIPGDDISQKFEIILGKLVRASFLSWFIFTFVVIAVLFMQNWILSKRIKHLKLKLTRRHYRVSIKLINKYQFIKGVNYGIVSGTLTAHTFLFAKSLIDTVVEIIMSSSHNLTQLTINFTPYLLLIIMLSIIGFQLTAFNLGLAQISTCILYPLCFLVYNLVNLANDVIFNSLLVDHHMSYGQLFRVMCGLVAVLFGVVLISWDDAFGNRGSSRTVNDSSVNEEEFIITSKFPYRKPSQYKFHDDHNEGSSTASSSLSKQNSAHSLHYLEPQSTYTEVPSELHGDSNTQKYKDFDDDNGSAKQRVDTSASANRKHKRVLSHEQNQLMLSLDV